MIKTIQIVTFLTLLVSFNSIGQYSPRHKELFQQLKTEKNDSIRIYLMSEIAYEYENTSLSKAIVWYNKGVNLAKKSNSKYWIYRNYGFLGIVYQFKHDYDSSAYFNEKAIVLAKANKDTLNQCKLYCNLGKTYFEYDKSVLAVKAYNASLAISKKINNQELIATCYRGLGVTYDKIGNLKYALNYHLKALEIDKKAQNQMAVAMDYTNIATVYDDLQKFDSANNYYDNVINIYAKEGLTGEELGIIYNNKASIETKKNDHKKALSLFFKAKEQFELSKDEGSIPFINKNIASAYLQLNNIVFAKSYIDSALMELTYKSNPRITLEAKLILCEILMKQNKNKEAAALLLRIYNLKENLEESYHRKQIDELEIKFQSNEKDSKIKQAEIEKKKNETELSLQKSLNQRRSILAIGLLLVGILLFFLFLNVSKSNKKTKLANEEIAKQNREVRSQKQVIEEKSEEITASIRYAQNIQTAILPPRDLVNLIFSKNFIFYRPKDIVAGDFYWFEQIDNFLFFAAADCTGHGVPGAMVSIVCHNALNQTIREYKLTDSAEILDKTRELVIQTFEKSQENIKDGMDISLCVINKETNVLQFSGANNSLWIIRDNQLQKLKADRQAIGFTLDKNPFESHTFQLKSKDRIYALTDGFADQFGGEFEKKFKTKKLEEYILSIQHFKLQEQENLLSTEFDSWKGEISQTDDVCILGIEI